MAGSSPQHEPRVIDTIRDDFRSVWPEVRREGVGRTIGRTFGELGDFYLAAERRERLAAMGRARRALWLSWWLLKGLFLKLTPARRVLLVLALVALASSPATAQSGSVDSRGALGVALLLVVLSLELKDKLLAREELEAGRAVQRALMPPESPSIPGWDAWLFTRPANDVGGDLVDCLPLGKGRQALVLADVAGKGLPAALLMAKLQATLRALAPEGDSLPALGARLNRILRRDTPRHSFATLLYLEIEPGSDRLLILNAGHPPPLLARGSSVAALPLGSLALGLSEPAEFGVQELRVGPDDLLCVYSDGVSEAMNEAGDLFGEPRLRDLLAQAPRSSARAAGAFLVEAVERFARSSRLADDVSVILIRRAA